MKLISIRAILVAVAASCLACGESAPAGGDPAVARGLALYKNVCIACHNGDPSQEGSLGPAIAGASVALLEAKILRGEYPPGHTPARPTQQMPKFEYLADHIPDLAAYLANSANAAQKQAGG